MFIHRSLYRLLFVVILILAGIPSGAHATEPIEKQLTRPDMTLFTTWFTDPCRSMAMQWLLYTPDSTPQAQLLWQANGDANWQSTAADHEPFPRSQLTRYRVQLSDLKPDTLYNFKFTDSDMIYTFRTAPVKLPEKLVFAAGGDSGSWPAAVQVNEQAAKIDPLFAWIGGDLAYANGVNVDAWIVFLNNWRKQMHRSDNSLIPLLVCIGNHEVEGHYNKPRDKAPFFFKLFEPLFSDTTYKTLVFGDYLQLIMLDTSHITPVQGDQTDWLKTTLANKVTTYRFVIYHVPGYPGHRPYDGKLSTQVRTHWSPLFEQYHVPVVFENHDHCYKRTYPLVNEKPVTDGSGVIYLGDGAWGAGTRDIRKDIQPELYAKTQKINHFIEVTLTNDSQSFRAISNKGDVVDEVTLANE
jgi:hypothetical protein